MSPADAPTAATTAERLTSALGRLERQSGAGADDARDAVRAVLSLHAEALRRVLAIAEAAGEPGHGVAEALAKDELVGSVLVLHGLHPTPLEGRVRAALERLGQSLAHCSVSLVELTSDALRLRLRVPAGSEGLASMVEDALCAAAPDAPPLALEVVVEPRPDSIVPVARLLGRPKVTTPAEGASDRCELCGAALAPEHEHLVEPAARALACACGACVALFAHGSGRWRRVARRAEALEDFHLDDARWAELGLPVEIAFFADSSVAGRVLAFYPGPAGATESLLPLDAWQAILTDNPSFAPLEPDVEALLVHRGRAAREHYRVSIDVAYELVGVLRRHWRGLSGGADARREVADFFARLGSPSRSAPCCA